ncbi:interferon-induced transmembrane protein 3 [Chaetodon trifascialis]|uniref:interferon-induced transmembrane protein 3 n=1 Tax=Chaetodon trifascialis TaxID=109706 RepID=UPI0039930473
MDFNSTSAGWTDEKTSMGQVPPPYHDRPQPGYTQQDDGVPLQYGGVPQQLYPAGHQPAAVVAVQPTTVYVTRVPLANPVNDYLCYSIFTLLCCCLPIGIAALVYSISTREANNIGDQEAAERNSKTARILNHVALGVGIGVTVMSIVYIVVLASRLQN